MHKSPPTSSGETSQIIAPPRNPFSIVPPGAQSTILDTPPHPSTGSRSPGYSTKSYSHSTSPSTASGGLPEIQNHDTQRVLISPTHISSASLNSQKRAYRQRRKDPSCDACRERKVKCDATETSACSECSSRNHKCQFTKETNRRMSSIKQVQDLQSQIVELTQLNSHLRSKVSEGGPDEIERPDTGRRQSDIQMPVPATSHRLPPPTMNNFQHVRDNIMKYSQGIFRTPHTREVVSAEFMTLPRQLQLPTFTEFARLSQSYRESVHLWYPIVHWPTFQIEVEVVYAANTFEGTPRDWIGLFYGILACGSLQTGRLCNGNGGTPSIGAAFYDIAAQTLSPWPQEISLMHIQLAFLLSIYAAENDMRSAGSMWLACAVQAAQELKLYCETNSQTSMESETRRRVWWAIYVQDRITAIEYDRPMLINDDDCEVSMPSPVDDRNDEAHEVFHTQATSAPFSGALVTIDIAKIFVPVHRALKSSKILQSILPNLDELLSATMVQLPEAYRKYSNAPLEMAALPPLFMLLSAQYHFYRRNLTPLCPSAKRADALTRCLSVAQETAKYISRTIHSPPQSERAKSWQTRVPRIASNMACLHLWRCILVLCFRGDYDAALMCLHLSSAIGNIRKTNVECGKYILFFLERLEVVRHGRRKPHELEEDEELLAYVSGDAQGSSVHSWVWANTDPTFPTSSQHFPTNGTHSRTSDEAMRDTLPLRMSTGSSDYMAGGLDVWARIEHKIRHLMEENRPRTAQPTYYPPPHNPMKRVQLASDTRPLSNQVPQAIQPPSNSSRISIANII